MKTNSRGPIYMKKAALLHESVEDYDEALDLYKKD